MAYNKHVWALGETITSALLNNIENAVDGISDGAYTFAGQKTFTGNDIKVSKTSAGIELEDTDSGRHFLIRSHDNKLEIYEVAVGTAMTNLLAHQHGGTVDGLKVDHPDLTTIGVDDHHNQSHGPSDHDDRFQSIYIDGAAMYASNAMLDSWVTNKVIGPELRDANDDYCRGGFVIPDNQKWKLTTLVQAYVHMKVVGGSGGGTDSVVLDVDIYEWDDADVGATSLYASGIQQIDFSQDNEIRRWALPTTINFSAAHDAFSFRILRSGNHLNDDLASSLIITGFEVLIGVDQ